MFDTIRIYKRKIECNVDYDTLKQYLEKLAQEDDKFLVNAEMECNQIINGDVLEFNSNTSSLLLSVAAFMISFFGIEIIPVTWWTVSLYTIAILIVGIASIKLHARKQNAEKIKFVLERE